MERLHIRACADIVAVSEPWTTLRETVEFSRYITRKEAYVCIHRWAGKSRAVGFIIFSPEPVFARGGYIRAIGVSPLLRRHCIGSSLLAYAEKKTARRASNIYLCVSSFNRQARAFYRNCGYAKVGTLVDLTSPGTVEYIYRKQIAAGSRKPCNGQSGSAIKRTGITKGTKSRP